MVYLMLLEKSPTQEEFIRGQLTNNPYNSAEVGPLMRDVKNFICRELDMEGKPLFGTVIDLLDVCFVHISSVWDSCQSLPCSKGIHL